MEVAVIIIVIIVAIIMITIMKSSERKADIEERQQKLGFNFARELKDSGNRYLFGISEDSKKVVIIYPDSETILSYEDILGVDVVVDGNMVASRSLGKLVGASALGGIIGAMAVDQKIRKKVSDIHVDIHTKLLSNPNIRIQVLSVETEQYKGSLDFANEIAGLIKIVIDKVEQEEKTKSTLVTAATNAEESGSEKSSSASGLIAEELEKLASLKEKGVLSETEFEAQKKKLLNL